MTAPEFRLFVILIAVASSSTFRCVAPVGGVEILPYRGNYELGDVVIPKDLHELRIEARFRAVVDMCDRTDASVASLRVELQSHDALQRHSMGEADDGAPNRHPTAPSPLPPLATMTGALGVRMERLLQSSAKKRSAAFERILATVQQTFDSATVLPGDNVDEDDADADDDAPPPISAAAMAHAAALDAKPTSPVAWSITNIISRNRASDSSSITCRVVHQQNSTTSKTLSVAEFTDAVRDVVTSGATSVASSALSLRVSSRVVSVAKNTYERHRNTLASTLVVSAMAEHRMVKQFDTLHLKGKFLRKAWNRIHPDRYIPDPKHFIEDFSDQWTTLSTASDMEKAKSQVEGQQSMDATTSGGQTAAAKQPPPESPAAGDNGGKPHETKKNAKPKRTLAIITELYTGSAVIGMMHFSQNEQLSSAQSNKVNRDEALPNGTKTIRAREFSALEVKHRLKLAAELSSLTGSTSFTNDAANQLMQTASAAALDVHFDLVVAGYVPRMASSSMRTALRDLRHFDPSQMETGAMNENVPSAHAAAQGQQQSNMVAVIGATVGALHGAVSAEGLTMKAFVDAFDDFAAACAHNTGTLGVPVAFGVQELTEMDVWTALVQQDAPWLLIKRHHRKRRIRNMFKKQLKQQQQRDAIPNEEAPPPPERTS